VPIVTGSKFENSSVAARLAQRPGKARIPGATAPGVTP